MFIFTQFVVAISVRGNSEGKQWQIGRHVLQKPFHGIFRLPSSYVSILIKANELSSNIVNGNGNLIHKTSLYTSIILEQNGLFQSSEFWTFHNALDRC